jgi:hypothetical protein
MNLPESSGAARFLTQSETSWTKNAAVERRVCLAGPLLVGRTPAARATINLLQINAQRRVEVRAALMEEGVH